MRFFYNFKAHIDDFYQHELVNYELVGPFVFFLSFSVFWSLRQENVENAFTTIFLFLSICTLVLIVNLKLLKAKITYFQGISLIGYLLVPMTLSIILNNTLLFLPWLVKAAISLVSLMASLLAAERAMKMMVSENKKVMAMGPFVLFLLSLFCFVMGN